jgi:hypothetical protein
MTIEQVFTLAILSGAMFLALVAVALRQRRLSHNARPPAAPASPTPPLAADPIPLPAAQEVDLPLAREETPHDVTAIAGNGAPHPAEAHRPVAAHASNEPVEVMRVLRDAQAGSLLVEIGGQRFARINDIKDQARGMRVVEAVLDLQRFVGLDVIAPLAAQQAAQPPPRSEPEPLMRPSLNPIKQMMILKDRELKKSREKDASPPGSIVEEIEAILVKRLVGSPFEGRSIHMRPGLHGGAHIDVDGHGYESIEDIADPVVKDFLKTVIAEWEKGR